MANTFTASAFNAPHTFDAVWNVVALMNKADKRRLVEKLVAEEQHEMAHDFPKINKDWKPQPIVYKMVEGRLPIDVDIEEERQKMWEELSR